MVPGGRLIQQLFLDNRGSSHLEVNSKIQCTFKNIRNILLVLGPRLSTDKSLLSLPSTLLPAEFNLGHLRIFLLSDIMIKQFIWVCPRNLTMKKGHFVFLYLIIGLLLSIQICTSHSSAHIQVIIDDNK